MGHFFLHDCDLMPLGLAPVTSGYGPRVLLAFIYSCLSVT